MHFPSSTSSSSLITAIFCLLLVIASLFLPGAYGPSLFLLGAYGRALAISTKFKPLGSIPAVGRHHHHAGVYATRGVYSSRARVYNHLFKGGRP